MRIAWAPPCASYNLTTITFGDQGARITVQKRLVPAFRALEAVFAKHSYDVRRADTGAYNCRQITGGSGYSLHAYGIAVDVNWQTNPYSSRLITDMPAAMIRDVEALRTNSGAVLFRWGGRYSGSKDAMHFEVMATPAEVATGITGGQKTLTPLARAGISAQVIRELRDHPQKYPYLKKGKTGRPVRIVQAVLGAPVTGVYGPGTEKKVRELQRLLDRKETGKVSGELWSFILFVHIARHLGYDA